MTLGSWNPDDGSEKIAYQISPTVLEQCAQFAAIGDWETLQTWEKEYLPNNAAQLMKLTADQWQPFLQPLETDTLLVLARFFTIAEQQLPHWHGGDKSPVIWIARTLKKRSEPLSREMVLWIKSHTDNRFLPNGPIL
jgi:hypothetical protein